MSARDALFWDIWDNRKTAEKNAVIDAFAHELAEKIRGKIERRCVNDSNGDGDCAACARNPQAFCRQPTAEGQVFARAADLIDPAVTKP